MPTLPTTAREAFSRGSGAKGVSGSPGTSDKHEKHFRRQGFEIVEVAASEIAGLSNDRKDVAFCIVDDDGVVNATWKMSDRNAVFSHSDDDMELSLGGHFNGAGRLLQTEDRAEGVELRGFGIDARQGGKGVNLSINKGAHLRDITIRGEGDSNQEWGCGIYCSIPRGEKVVLENVNQPDGASRFDGVKSTHDSIGTLLDGRSNGVLEMRGCTYGGFGNNGVYASGSTKQGNDGYAKIYNHVGYNSDRDQLRVGGESIIDGADLYIDQKKPGFDNLRGVWSRYARGVTIRDMSFRSHTSDSGEGVRIDSTAGRTTIEDCDIEMRSSHKAARGVTAFAPGANAGDDHRVVIKDTRIHGSGTSKDAVLVKSRPTTFENLDIDMPDGVEPIDVR